MFIKHHHFFKKRSPSETSSTNGGGVGGDGGQKPYTRQSSNSKLSQAELQAKINNHLSIGLASRAGTSESNPKSSDDQTKVSSQPVQPPPPNDQIISNESKEDEKSDIKVIDSTDEKTGTAIRTSIENRVKTNETVKVCKAGEQIDVQETDDAIIKKITTKTRTTKSVIKTTTTTTTKKGIFRVQCREFRECFI